MKVISWTDLHTNTRILVAFYCEMVFSRVPLPKPTKLRVYSKTNYLKNAKVAQSLVDKLDLKKQYSAGPKVLDVYSNNLVFSAALYNHLEPSQYLLMELRKDYQKHITNYLDGLNQPHAFQLLKQNPFDWESYLSITEKTKLLQPGIESRDHLHSSFLFTGAVCEEGLIMQWLSCLGHQNWIQRFGNVKMLLWIPQATAIKISAPPFSRARAKCSVVCQTFSDIKLISITNTPDVSKFDGDVLAKDSPTVLETSDFIAKIPMSLVEINPKEVQFGDIYNWEFVVKNLMILGTQELGGSVRNLGPGAEDYFNQVLPKGLLEKKVIEMETEDFITVANLFEEWPFKPNTLLDFIV